MIVSRKEPSQTKAAREAALDLNPSGPVTVLTPEQRAEFLSARPDLLKTTPKPAKGR